MYYSCYYYTATTSSLANTYVSDLLLSYERALSHLNSFRLYLGVFYSLIEELQSMGHGDTRYVTLEEQLTIFLYISVTDLTIHHVGE